MRGLDRALGPQASQSLHSLLGPPHSLVPNRRPASPGLKQAAAALTDPRRPPLAISGPGSEPPSPAGPLRSEPVRSSQPRRAMPTCRRLPEGRAFLTGGEDTEAGRRDADGQRQHSPSQRWLPPRRQRRGRESDGAARG